MATTPSYNELERRIEFLERELERQQGDTDLLREREQKYRRIFENAGEAIFLLKKDRYVDCNPMAQTLFGCSREQIIGTRPHRFSPARQADGVESEARSVLKISAALAGEPQFFEWRHTRLDGTAFDTEVSLTRIELRGEPLLQAIVRDVTERKKIEDSLRRSEEEYRTLVENLSVGVYRNTEGPQGRFLKINRAMLDIFGFDSAESFTQTPVAEFYCDPEQRREFIEELKRKGSVRNRRLLLRKKDGSPLWTSCTATVKKDEHGDLAWIEGVLEDISEVVSSEEELRQTNEMLKALFTCSPAAIISLDRKQRVNMWNPAAERIFGWKQHEVIGKTFPAVPESDTSHNRKLFSSIMDGKTLKNLQLVRQCKDGSEIIVNAAGSPLRNVAGDIIGLMSIMDDITERIQTQQDLQAAKAETEAANHELVEVNRQLEAAIWRANEMAQEAELGSMAKSQFLANMSHEIRTPLNGVIGFTDMLLDTVLDETQQEYTMTIKRSGEALLALINDILDFSKIEAGELEFEEIEFDLELLAYDVCELIRPKIEDLPVEILCRIADDVPARVVSDPLRLRQVMTNLLGNASKFTEAGEIELSLKVKEEMPDSLKIHAAIRDTGIGIPEDKIEHIFSPFQQVDGSTTRKYGGTGLGLSICRQIATLMDGDVWVESPACGTPKKCSENGTTTPGGPGSIFHFTAWINKTAAKQPPQTAAATLTGHRVLIVDDNRSCRQILEHILEAAGMQVVSLSRGEAVIDTLKTAADNTETFDCLISDIQMPGTNGYEVARQIRADSRDFRKIPLIALSSMLEDDARRCREAGFDASLTKPVRREKLYRTLEQALSPRQGDDDRPPSQELVAPDSVRGEMKQSVRILLAEDNPVNQKLAKLMLSKAGYQVKVAGTGREAVEKYKATPGDYDLIFMDIQMPDMDGIEATCTIREFQRSILNGAPRHIPIVAMTAHAMKGDRERCIEAGMDDYTTKPIKQNTVLSMLEKWVFKKR